MITRPHSPKRRALLSFILALTLLAGCSSASENASLTFNRNGGDFDVYLDGKMVDVGEQGQIALAPGAHRLLVGTEEVKSGVTNLGTIEVHFVAESAARYELEWRRLSRAGRGYWRAWVTDVDTGRYMTPEPVAGFEPAPGQQPPVQRFNIDFTPAAAPIIQPVTKFGGQPNWLSDPEWPLSRSTGRPMRFIGQFVLGDAGLNQQAGRIAYLFMTDSVEYGSGSPDVYDQYDPSMGENAVIIQPGSARQHETAAMSTGPTLVMRTPGWFQPVLTPVEYAVTLTEDIDPAYRSYASLPLPSGGSARMPIQAPDSAQWPVPPPTPAIDTEALDWRAHFEAVGGNKLGGTPPPLDPQHLPFSPERASLVLQLDMGEVPFFVDFGDIGIGRLFFDADTDKGWFMWSSG